MGRIGPMRLIGYLTIFARMSVSRRIFSSRPSTSTSLPEYLPYSTSSPTLTFRACRSPVSRSLPGPAARMRPRCGFCLAVSGSRMPPVVRSSASSGRTFRFTSVAFAIGDISCLNRSESPPGAPGGLGGSHHVHPAHAAHAAAHATHPAHAVVVVVVVAARLLLLRDVGDQRLGG